MAQKSPEILVRPKCHDLSPIPLNILILDDQNEDLKSVIDQDKYTVHVGPLDEHYVSTYEQGIQYLNDAKKLWRTEYCSAVYLLFFCLLL